MCKESLIDFSKYTISDDGTIFSKHWSRNLSGCLDKDDYVQVRLKCTDGKSRQYKWHRVIYYFFKGEIPEDLAVNHIDENKQNNALSNLNLMTVTENNNWGTRNERSAATKTKNHIRQFDLETNETIKIWLNAREIERELGYSNVNIYRCCKGGYFLKGKWINKPQYKSFGWEFI